jgi:hypothetical protein
MGIGFVRVTGITAVMNRWSLTNKHIGRRAAGALKKGGNFLKDKSQELVPTESGELHDSAYVKNIGKRSGFGAVIEVGYTAPHAPIVHEDLTKAHGAAFNAKNYSKISSALKGGTSSQRSRFKLRRSQEQAKFLEAPARMYRRQIRRIIATNAKI